MPNNEPISSYWQLSFMGKVIVEIWGDGAVVLGPGVSTNEATVHFWIEVQKCGVDAYKNGLRAAIRAIETVGTSRATTTPCTIESLCDERQAAEERALVEAEQRTRRDQEVELRIRNECVERIRASLERERTVDEMKGS